MSYTTTDRVSVSIRWMEETWDRVCELATEWGVSRNDMANILIREAIDHREREKAES